MLGKAVKAYRNEPNVADDSNVETYVAMKLEINNWPWAGVPFTSGPASNVGAQDRDRHKIKQAPYAAFQHTPVDALSPNWLVLHIAPGEGISLQFEVRRPGPIVDLAEP